MPFSLVHVALMVFLSHGFYALLGESYDFGPGFDEVLYEYRKDLLTYALFAATFWAAGALQRGRAGEVAAAPAPPETFDINEGQRMIRVDRADILSARSRSEEHTSELQSLMRISYAVFCLKKKKNNTKAIYKQN